MKTKALTLCILISFLHSACSSYKELDPSQRPIVNQTMTSGDSTLQLIGLSDKSGLEAAPFSSWFLKAYNDYEPDQKVLATARKKIKNVEVLAFMGTWCGDSKREVPKFYKVMDELKLDEEKVKLVNVYRDSDRYKKSPTREEEGLNIHRVPTFIFYKEGHEIGRIVERPMTSMEVDVAQIICEIPSEPRYRVVSLIESLFNENKAASIKEKEKGFGAYTSRNTTSSSELNTYGYVLLAQGRIEDAIQVFIINTIAYPKDANTYDSLAEAYNKFGAKELAIQNYERVLELEPDNENALAMISEISRGVN